MDVLLALDHLLRHFVEVKGDLEVASRFLCVARLLINKLNGCEPKYGEDPFTVRLYLALRRMARKGMLDPQLVAALIEEITPISWKPRAFKASLRDVTLLYLASSCTLLFNCT